MIKKGLWFKFKQQKDKDNLVAC